MAGTPIRSMFPFGVCGAKTRKGTPCKIRLEVFLMKNKKLRCALHGGKSTGAKTAAGLARCLAAARERWRRYREAQALKKKDEL